MELSIVLIEAISISAVFYLFPYNKQASNSYNEYCEATDIAFGEQLDYHFAIQKWQARFDAITKAPYLFFSKYSFQVIFLYFPERKCTICFRNTPSFNSIPTSLWMTSKSSPKNRKVGVDDIREEAKE